MRQVPSELVPPGTQAVIRCQLHGTEPGPFQAELSVYVESSGKLRVIPACIKAVVEPRRSP